ncbi:RING-H2 finger protein ATL2-like [Vicia villosa]|uniref:RING-H2 finger protein ATL2-like n=1 Tax=Vicia villosa TaxID=3911 RepID=UPI00273C5BE9|nr:RING-H2 finger protein ATL2-like [Vicia villosa]
MDSGMEDGKESENYYAHSGKIMVSTVIILFLITITLLSLHLLIRWYLLRYRHSQQHLRRTHHARRHSFVFYFEHDVPASLRLDVSRGLDPSVISSLPVFKYSSEAGSDQAVDCAVCLSEFEEGEIGRILPKCNHSFHVDCIDMWFHTHSTCPLCRKSVELLPVQQAVDVCEPELVLGSSFGEESNRYEPELTSTSCSNEKQSSLVGVTVEVPGTSEGEPSSSSFRSPMSRVLSFTRILSRERKSSVSATSDCIVELDAERVGRGDSLSRI